MAEAKVGKVVDGGKIVDGGKVVDGARSWDERVSDVLDWLSATVDTFNQKNLGQTMNECIMGGTMNSQATIDLIVVMSGAMAMERLASRPVEELLHAPKLHSLSVELQSMSDDKTDTTVSNLLRLSPVTLDVPERISAKDVLATIESLLQTQTRRLATTAPIPKITVVALKDKRSQHTLLDTATKFTTNLIAIIRHQPP
jgi:hypothetical protein